MRSILNLFGRSPFGPLQKHMTKVTECAARVPLLFDALYAGDEAAVARIAGELSQLENQADEIKNEIRAHLPKSLFLPVDRGDLLTLLGTADGIADFCEDLGILLTMRKLTVPDTLRDPLRLVVQRALATAAEADRLLDQLDELVEASFGGPEAKKVSEIIDNLGRLEHECDRAQWEFARAVFAIERDLSAGELWMFLKLGNTLGNLANAAENVGKRLQLMIHI
jgi:hypothetical protein